MFIKISADGTADLPEGIIKELGAGPGDRLLLEKTESGFTLRRHSLDESLLGYLSDKIPPGIEPFDIHKFRQQVYDPKLRD